MTLKFIFGIAVTALCALAGHSFAGANVRRARMLAELMDALQILRVHMLDRLMPLKTALTGSGSSLFSCVGENIGENGASQAWSEVKKREMKRGGKLDCLTSSDEKVLDALFDSLGVTGKNEQRPVIDCAIRELGLLEAKARSDSGDKNRLYTTLGALGGMALVIFII